MYRNMTGRHIMSSPTPFILKVLSLAVGRATVLVMLFFAFAAPNAHAQQVRDVSFNEAVHCSRQKRDHLAGSEQPRLARTDRAV